MKSKSKHSEENNSVNEQLEEFNIKECFVRVLKLTKIGIKSNELDANDEIRQKKVEKIDKEEEEEEEKDVIETTVIEMEQPVVKRGRGRPSLKAKKVAETEVTAVKEPTTPPPTTTTTEGETETEKESGTVSPTPPTVAKPAAIDKAASKRVPLKKRETVSPSPTIENDAGGRSRRTPKPNPKYMNDDTVVITKSLLMKDDTSSENEDDDEVRTDTENEKPRKKHVVQTVQLADGTPGVAKRGPGRPPKSAKKWPGAKSTNSTPAPVSRTSPVSVATKRKITETDIDIDDEHGKQLFLDAKRRLTHTPIRDDEFSTSKGKSTSSPSDGPSSALAAKLRAKFSNDIPVKKSNSVGRPAKSTIRISPKFMNKAKERGSGGKITSAQNRTSSGSTADKDITIESVDMEDFEQMATFTIVNINDIMNQKNEDAVLVRKRKYNQAIEQVKQEEKDTEESSEDDNKKETSDNESPSNKPQNNRRKTQHTKILSDDKLAKNTTSASTKTTSSKAMPIKTNTSPKTAHVPLLGANNNGRFKDSNKPAILRPPPRILNSQLCKPGKSSTALVTKLITSNDDLKAKQNNNTIRSKENNVTSYTYTEKDGRLVPRKAIVSPIKSINTPPNARINTIKNRTPSSVSVPMPKPMPLPISNQSPANRRVKKITCFETWYVIKTPENKRVIEKSIVLVNLLQLGNQIKNLHLPASDWSYKITLQALPKNLKLKKGAGSTDDSESSKAADSSADSATESDADLYTGEVHDPTIKEEHKHLYRPASIVFRRKQQTGSSRVHFDRTVIFKNRTFFVNVDGKNIRLVAAPQYIHGFKDIEILLQVVNDINLKHVDVELLTLGV